MLSQTVRAGSKAVNTVLSAVTGGQQKQHMQQSACSHVLTMENLNPNIEKMEYAVRGPIVARASQIEEELKQVQYETSFMILNIFCV